MDKGKDYSELVERLRKSHWKPAPECLEAITALQRRAKAAEAVVEAARKESRCADALEACLAEFEGVDPGCCGEHWSAWQGAQIKLDAALDRLDKEPGHAT